MMELMSESVLGKTSINVAQRLRFGFYNGSSELICNMNRKFKL